MTLQAPSSESQLALSLEKFVKKAEAFLADYYLFGVDSQDVSSMLQEVKNLQLDIDEEALEREFELYQERKDLEGDYYDSAWF